MKTNEIRITNSQIFLIEAKLFCHGILHGEHGRDFFRVLRVLFSVAFPITFGCGFAAPGNSWQR
jgi:hypothetical protein